MNALLIAAALSEATLLRMGPMPVEPVIDNVITRAEQTASSGHYGLISHANGLMAVRYNVAYFGWTAKGFYFAVRSSVPEAPQKLTDEDTITLTLLPPGGEKVEKRGGGGQGRKPLTFRKKVSEGRRLKGVTQLGVLVAETEMFVPFSASLPMPKDGETWGFNMTLDYSSERETASFHHPMKKAEKEGGGGDCEELATLVIDSAAPTVSFDYFGSMESWRTSGNCRFGFRLANNSAAPVKFAAKKSTLLRGVDFSKLDSGVEENLAKITRTLSEFKGVTVAPGEKKMVYHYETNLWPGTLEQLDLDLLANGMCVYRRKLSFDVSRGKKWKPDALPKLLFKYFPSYGHTITLQCDANGAKDLVNGRVTLKGVKSGKTFWQKQIAGGYAFKTFSDEISIPDLPEDDYELTFTCEDVRGKTYSHTRTFANRKFPWQGNSIGKDRVIIPPFKPIRVEKGEKVEKVGGGGQRNDSSSESNNQTIQQSNNPTISFLQTGYKCGGVLWDEISGKGENLLTAPVTLTLNGQEFTVTGTKILEQADDRVVREVTAEIPLSTSTSSLHLTVTQTYDYDGYCWVTFAFDAPEPVEVKNLRLTVPFKDKLVKFLDGALHPEDKRAGPAPDITVPAGEGVVWQGITDPKKAPAWKREKYPSYISTYLYIGGVFKGLAFEIDSVRDLSVSWDKAPQRLVRKGDTLTYEFDLVSKPTTWVGRKKVEMAFQPTPVKPKDPATGKFGEVMYSYPCPSNAIQTGYTRSLDMWRQVFPHKNYYPNDDRSMLDYYRSSRLGDRAEFDRRLDAYIARNREWLEACPVTSPDEYRSTLQDYRRKLGPSFQPRYFDPLLLSCFWPEWEMYKGEWYPWDWLAENLSSEYMCNVCASRIDKLMWDAKDCLVTGDKGLYFDCFQTSFVSSNHPQPDSGAYLRPNGTIQWSLSTIRQWREIMKRSAILCYRQGKLYNGRPFVELHDTSGALPMLLSWCATGLSTERGGNGGEFPIRFPESYSLVSIIGAHTGKGTHFIVSGSKGDTARQTRELMSLVGFMCAYGCFSLADQGLIGGNRQFEKAWNIPFDFGWGEPEVEQFTYWDEEKTMPVEVRSKKEEGRSGETKVRVSVGKKKDSALVMFGSLGTDPETVTFDLSGLGFGPNAKVTDAETGKPFAGNTLTLGRFGYRMLLVGKR